VPELPEVETIKRELEKLICGKVIKQVTVLDPKAVFSPAPPQFKEELVERRVDSLERRGKYILFCLSGRVTLLAHLRMTGQLVYCRNVREASSGKHTRLVLYFLDRGALSYRDQRRLGGLWLLTEEELASFPPLASLGPDILEAVEADRFAAMLRHRGGRGIKPLLLDQRFVAGLGNIYTDEALFCAGIHPERQAGSLSKTEKYRLYYCIQKVLRESLAKGGTSTRNYVNGQGKAGGFQKQLQVYNRKGQPCRRCGRPIERIAVGGRGTHYCSFCQPL